MVNHRVNGEVLLEGVWLDGEGGYGFREEVFDPDTRAFDVVNVFYSAFRKASSLVVQVVLVEDAGDFDFIP